MVSKFLGGSTFSHYESDDSEPLRVRCVPRVVIGFGKP